MVEVEEEISTFLDLLRLYKVIFHNDEKTTWSFVVEALQKFFGKTLEEANRLTKEVDTSGCAVVGVFSRELAELKQEQTLDLARGRGFPFQVSIEKD